MTSMSEKHDNPREQLFLVVVNHLLGEGAERQQPIPVNDLGDDKRGVALCYPNKPVVLTQVQINILNEAAVIINK